MAHPYHTLAELVPARLPSSDLIQLTQDDPGVETAKESVYELCREDADGEIDGYLGERYAVPLTEVPPMVRRLSMTLTVVYLYHRRYAGKLPEEVGMEAERARKLLRALADGRPTLGLQPAPTENTQRAARLVSNTPVFSRSSMKGF